MVNAAQNKMKDLNLTPPDNSNLHIFINFPPAGKPYWPTVLYIVAAPLYYASNKNLCYAFLRILLKVYLYIIYIIYHYIETYIISYILFLSDFCAKLFSFVYDGFRLLNCQTTTFHNKPILPHIERDCKVTKVIK